MKLVRFGAPGREKPGIVDKDGKYPRPVESRARHRRRDTVAEGPRENPQDRHLQAPAREGRQPRLGPCVGGTRHFIAIGLNYADHAAEAGAQVPKEPIIFQKAPTCICGPNDDTMIPKGSTKLDWEVELGIVIGSRARYLSKKDALDAVAG